MSAPALNIPAKFLRDLRPRKNSSGTTNSMFYKSKPAQRRVLTIKDIPARWQTCQSNRPQKEAPPGRAGRAKINRGDDRKSPPPPNHIPANGNSEVAIYDGRDIIGTVIRVQL